MDNSFWQLSIKIAKPKKQRITGYKKQSKLVIGTVIEDADGNLKIEIDTDNNGTSPPKVLNFTPESFDVVNRTSVFTKTKDKFGRRCRIIRNDWHAKFHPGNSEQYLPFDCNWTVKGYIVKSKFTELFDFKSLIGIDNYKILNDKYEPV